MGNVRVSGSEQVECDANSKSDDKVISQERLYLPEFVLGKRVLVAQGATTYLANNSDLQSDKATVSFHSSPSMDDRLERVAAYGSVVTGELSNGWLKVEIQNTHRQIVLCKCKTGHPQTGIRLVIHAPPRKQAQGG